MAGLFTLLIAPFFSKLVRFFPPVVTGTVITIIGITLIPVAAIDAGGGQFAFDDPDQVPRPDDPAAIWPTRWARCR